MVHISINPTQTPNSTTFDCLICLSSVTQEKIHSDNVKVAEILSDLFKVLCMHMKWSPPPKCQFDFKIDRFPFCKECRSLVVRLSKFNQMLLEVQGQIDQLTLNLSARILESKKKGISDFTLDKRLGYYRYPICRRFSTSVRLVIDPQVVDAQQKFFSFNNPPECPEEGNAESSGENSVRSVGCTSPTLSESVSIQLHSAEIVDETSSGEDGVKNNESVWTERKDRNLNATGQESEMQGLQKKRRSRRKCTKKADYQLIGEKVSEAKEEVASDESPDEAEADDSDYQPNVLSACEDDYNSGGERSHIEKDVIYTVQDEHKPHFMKGSKYFERIRYVGGKKYLFDEKYPFERHSENNWTCCTCGYVFQTNQGLKNHLAGPCKGVLQRAELPHGVIELPWTQDGDLFTCDLCAAGCSSTSAIQEHIREKHADQASRLLRKFVDEASLKEAKSSDDNPVSEVEDSSFKSNGQDEQTFFTEPEDPPFPSLRDRLKKVGPWQFLLDDKCHFEVRKTNFKCISCDLVFRPKYELLRHLYDCPGNPSFDVVKSYRFKEFTFDLIKTTEEFRCRHCKRLDSSIAKMVHHFEKQHIGKHGYKYKLKPWYVEVEPNKYSCNRKFPFEFADDKFKCETCLKEFSTKPEVLFHIQKEHILPGVKVRVLFKNNSPDKFVWTSPLNVRFSFEKVEDEYRCGHCKYFCTNIVLMKEHVKDRHIDPRKSTCHICGKVFSTELSLKGHLKSKYHSNDPSFICEICGKAFHQSNVLTIHRQRVHPEICRKKYPCQVCGRVYGSKSLLNAHSDNHEMAVCDVCGKEFSRKRLRVHVHTHKENSFECRKCGKKFRYPHSLYIHLKSHDGTKPYSCDICGMKFTQHYSVTRHKNVVHNSNKTPKGAVKSRKSKLQDDEEELRESTEEMMSDEGEKSS